MNRFYQLIPIIALAASSSLLVGQALLSPATQPQPQQPPSSAISQAFGAGHTDGVTWAAGPRYQATFGPGTVELTPALGNQAPRDLPVRFTLESIRRGDTEVFAAPPAEQRALPQVDGNRVLFEHGNGLTERYDASAAHLEQSFKFAEQPAGRGDLVVRLQLDTELEAATGRDLDGLRLASEFGGVDIGAVLGIDALGQSAPGRMHFDGSHLELVLPDAFVSSAAYPMVLDPPIGPFFTVANAGVANCCPDVSYTTGVYLVVWQHQSSQATSIVRAVRVSPSGNLVGSILQISGSSANGKEPAVASVPTLPRFVIAWAQGGDIYVRSVNPYNGTMASPYLVAGGAANDYEPDIGGSIAGPFVVNVAWTRAGIGIESRIVRIGAGSSLPPYQHGPALRITSDFDAEKPAISKHGGLDRRYAVVWESGPPNRDFGIRIVDNDGNAHTAVSSHGGIEWWRGVSNPDVDGDGQNWLVVWEQQETPGSSLTDIAAANLWDGNPTSSTNAANMSGVAYLESTANDDDNEPAVCMVYPASSGEPRWLVTIGDEFAGSGDYLAYGINVAGTPWHTCGPWARIDNGGDNRQSAAASKYSGGSTLDGTALIVVATDAAAINGRLWETFSGGPVTPVAGVTGCGVGGTIDVNGPAAIGNLNFAVTLSGAGPNAGIGLFYVNVSNGPVVSVCGGLCNVITSDILETVPLTGGSASRPISIGCNTSLVGFEFEAQWGVVSNQQGGCSLLPWLHFSDAIKIVIGS